MNYTIKNTGTFIIGLNYGEHVTLEPNDEIERELTSVEAKEIETAYKEKGLTVELTNPNPIEVIEPLEVKEIKDETKEPETPKSKGRK
jgi:hypothetical protein